MAKSDSLPTAMTAMINLCSMVVEDPVLELLSEVLSVLYHHLQGDPASLPVKEKVLGFEPETVMAATSLAFMAQFFSSQYLGPEVLSSIEDQWPSIWRWASYIVEQGIVMERDEPVEGQIMSRGHLQGVMGDLFSALTAQNRLCEIIGSSPGVVPTITRLYFFAGQNAHPSQILLSQALQRLIVDLNMTLEATAIQGFWEGTASAFNVRPSDLASALLSSINNELSRPKIACFPLLGSLINLSGCTRDGGAFTLAGGSIHERSVSSMVRIFSRLTSRKQFYDRHPVNYRMAVGCLKFTGQYLQRCFDYGGFSCIIEAVEGHLLSSILKAHRFVEYELEYPIPAPPVRLQTILVDLLKTVGSYTVYRSVLRAVYNSCGRIRKHSTEDDLNKHSALYESWRTFKDMIQPRVDIWGYWEEDDDINVCGRASCTTPTKSVTMRRCTGCCVALYCSKACQKSEWKEHKEVCDIFVQRRRLGTPREMDARDISFLEALIESDIGVYDYEEESATIKANYISKHPALKDETLIPKFDYRCMPMEQSFITLEELIHEDLHEDIDELIVDEMTGEESFYTIVPHHKTPLCRVYRR